MTVDVLLADVVQQRDLNEIEARTLVDGIRRDGMDVVERTAVAYKGRAWIALGYQSWDAMREAEFSDARLGIPREERAEQVQSLRASGMSTRGIGDILGIGQGTVRRDLEGAPNGAPVVGKDGKSYPASQPPRPAAVTTTEQFLADRETGEVLGSEDWRRALVEAGESFPCPDCPETFSVEVWHCPVDAHHWPLDEPECRNCYRPMPDPSDIADPDLWDAALPEASPPALNAADTAVVERIKAGETVVVNMRGASGAWSWAEQAGLAVRVDRKSIWGNPFLLDEDGSRDEICDLYAEIYYPHKASLHKKVADLAGKALGCWCAPARCHADHLAEMAGQS